MKKILTILFILISVSGYSQSTTPQFIGGKSSNLIVQSVFNMADSPKASFNLILPDTTTAKAYFSGNLKGRWARQNGRLYHNPSGLKFMLADSVTSGGGGSADSTTFYTTYRADTSRTNIYAAIASSGGSTDTTSLSTRIDARVKYTDTAAMLANYLNSGDIGVSVQGYNASTTILGNTTSGSGSTILLQGSPTITLPNIAAINVSGGILTLPTGASGTLMRLADTSTLSARINTKLNITDTANIRLRPIAGTNMTITGTYPNLTFNSSGGASGVTSVATTNGTGITGGTITTTGTLAIDTSTIISTKANVTAVAATKLNISDTASMLAPYLRSSDTAAMLSPYYNATDLAASTYLDQSGTKVAGTTAGTSTVYTLTLTPAITAYTAGLSLWVKFHVANTGAATINVNGLGAKTLVKDLSTALVANDIPINQWYTLVYDGTNFLIQDIGFGGVNLSARLLGALSDETGTGVSVFGTSPSFTTSILGSATFSAFNTVTTNLSIAGAATTFTEGGTPTTGLTATYFGNATASGQTKTLNFGTGGASGSTTAINIGSATSGATNNIKMNITPASDATGDMYYRNASGFLTRIPIGTTGQALRWNGTAIVWRDTAASGGGGGWGLTGNAGTTAGTNFLGTTDNVNVEIKANNLRLGKFIASTYSVALGENAVASGFWANGFGYGATASGQHGVSIGSYTEASDVGAIAVGYGAKAPNYAAFNISSNGGSGNYTTTVSRQGLLGADTRIDMQITSGVNILSVDANNITAQKPVILKAYTVATLPSAAANTNAICTVTDALAPTYNATVVGGGAVRTIVLSDGTNWTCH